ncbi:MAG TPA: hypothetical protein VGJ86_15445 [Acidimicrobiales bacterium]|jgi:protein-L-isoaspartate(D-aspartate) O-methyltransferase
MVDGAEGLSAQLRRRLVEHLWRNRLLHDRRVARAFLAVPREAFLPETMQRFGLTAVYRDDAIVTRRDPDSRIPLSSSSQPAIMALMLEMLDVRLGHRVLEIGAGTGYNAALLGLLVGPEDGLVVTVDIDLQIARQAAAALRSVGSRAHVVAGDGAVGMPGLAASRDALADRIEVTASSAAVPRAWYDQLADDGLLVVPIRLSDQIERAHAVTCLRKVAGGFRSQTVIAGGFMPLRRSDGSPFDPTGRTPPQQPDSPILDGGGRSPVGAFGRDQMDRLIISVTYGADPPPARWRFDRGDHWIGVGLQGE